MLCEFSQEDNKYVCVMARVFETKFYLKRIQKFIKNNENKLIAEMINKINLEDHNNKRVIFQETEENKTKKVKKNENEDKKNIITKANWKP